MRREQLQASLTAVVDQEMALQDEKTRFAIGMLEAEFGAGTGGGRDGGDRGRGAAGAAGVRGQRLFEVGWRG